MDSRMMDGSSWLAVLVPLAAVMSGCIVSDTKCGEHEVEIHEGSLSGCECAMGTVPRADNLGCEPCPGAFEEAVDGMCQCIAGYTKSSGVCAPTVDASVDASVPDASMGSGPLTGTNGQGDSCQTNADCAGKDATWCMNLRAPFQCLVQNCANGMRACEAGRVCCDLSALVVSLAPANGLCLPQNSCAPFGGKVVMP